MANDAQETQGVIQGIAPNGDVRNVHTDDFGVLLTGGAGSVAQRAILDYSTRTDSNPVFVGFAVQGALVSDASWTVKQLFYDVSSRLIDAQYASAIPWSCRANYGWRSPGGN